MDDVQQEQSRGWTAGDVVRFFRMYFEQELLNVDVPDIPFSRDQLHAMRAEAFTRGRSAYLRFLPPGITMECLDRAFKLGGVGHLRGVKDSAFSEIPCKHAWVCWMPEPIRNSIGFSPAEVKSYLAAYGDRLKLDSAQGQTLSPGTLTELAYLCMNERVINPDWPFGRTFTIATDTIIKGQRFNLEVSNDLFGSGGRGPRMRLRVSTQSEYEPLEGSLSPILYGPPLDK